MMRGVGLMEAFQWFVFGEGQKDEYDSGQALVGRALGLVRVNQGPHEDLKLVQVKIRGQFVDAIVNKNITLKSIVPYDRFLFSTAST
jgi:hypothetical protein